MPKAGLVKPDSVSGKNPEAVAEAALLTLYRSDTAIDTSPTDAARRARPWLTRSLAGAFGQQLPGGGGYAWLQLQKHHGWTAVHLQEATEAGAPPDGPNFAVRQYRITITPHGRDGWTGKTTQLAATVALTRPDSHSPWRVQRYQIL